MLAKLIAVAAGAALAAPAFADAGTAAVPEARLQLDAIPPGPERDGTALRQDSAVVDRRERRSPMYTVATNALYGGLAGAVIGAGVALINEGDDWGRDLMLGTGIGVLAGAVVGGVIAYTQQSDRDRVALDGLGTPERDRERQRRVHVAAAYTARW